MEALIFSVVAGIAAGLMPRLNWKGSAILAAVSVVAAFVITSGTVYLASSSYELISGRVTSKTTEYDPETEYYSCGPKGENTCTREIPRWRWDVKSDVGKSSQHTYSNRATPRWASTVIGEPFATTKRFRNAQYLSDQSVGFEHSDYVGWLPAYPDIRDGFRVDRCLSQVMQCESLSAASANAQREWGPKHKVNVLVVAVPVSAAGFDAALRKHWVGGKKNDAVVVLYLGSDKHVSDVKVFSRSTGTVLATDGRNFNTYLREAVIASGEYVDAARLVSSIATALPYFDREDLSKHDFWAETYQTPWWVTLIQFIALAGLFVAAYTFITTNPRLTK